MATMRSDSPTGRRATGAGAVSDGTGVPVDYFIYARDVSALDVVSLTDHDHMGVVPLVLHSARKRAYERSACSHGHVGLVQRINEMHVDAVPSLRERIACANAFLRDGHLEYGLDLERQRQQAFGLGHDLVVRIAQRLYL